MRFKEENKVIYCKNEYYKEFDNGEFCFSNDKEYYKGHLLHRVNGPAEKHTCGSKWWYKDGKKHRENGPAIEWWDGDKVWCKEGKMHREDGPAIEYNNSSFKEWYLNGVEYKEKEYNKIMRLKKKRKILDEI